MPRNEKIEFCKACGCRAAYMVFGKHYCGTHAVGCILDRLRGSGKVSISAKISLVNPQACPKDQKCSYWNGGCDLDKCVRE